MGYRRFNTCNVCNYVDYCDDLSLIGIEKDRINNKAERVEVMKKVKKEIKVKSEYILPQFVGPIGCFMTLVIIIIVFTVTQYVYMY